MKPSMEGHCCSLPSSTECLYQCLVVSKTKGATGGRGHAKGMSRTRQYLNQTYCTET